MFSGKIKIFCLLILAALFCFSCQKTENGAEDSGIFSFSDDTETAVQLVQDANDELKRIKILYNENEGKIDELKEALGKKDIEKVKEISNNLVYVINDGFIFADSAKGKLEKAQELNINETFKEYLSLKEESLEKQIEAFKFRHEAARLLRESISASDKLEIDQARALFKEKEENFQKTMEEARRISEQADNLAKESLKQKN